MARKRVKIIDLDSAIAGVLADYGNAVYGTLKESVEEVSAEAAQKLRGVTSFAPGRKPSGEYSSGWEYDEVRTGRLSTKMVLHNEKHYRLTHLLENGHVSRNGTGRTFDRVPDYPHIAPVNKWAEAELPRLVERKLK